MGIVQLVTWFFFSHNLPQFWISFTFHTWTIPFPALFLFFLYDLQSVLNFSKIWKIVSSTSPFPISGVRHMLYNSAAPPPEFYFFFLWSCFFAMEWNIISSSEICQSHSIEKWYDRDTFTFFCPKKLSWIFYYLFSYCF